MSQADPVYKTVEVTGTSGEGVTEAIRTAVERASKTLRNLDWVEVSSIRGRIEEGRIDQFQVTMKVGFRLEE